MGLPSLQKLSVAQSRIDTNHWLSFLVIAIFQMKFNFFQILRKLICCCVFSDKQLKFKTKMHRIVIRKSNQPIDQQKSSFQADWDAFECSTQFMQIIQMMFYHFTHWQFDKTAYRICSMLCFASIFISSVKFNANKYPTD